jgi:hypothetical protein
MIKKINEPCRAFSTTGSFFPLNLYPIRSLERGIGEPSKKLLIFILQVHVSRGLNAGIFMTHQKLRYVKTSFKKGLVQPGKPAIFPTT